MSRIDVRRIIRELTFSELTELKIAMDEKREYLMRTTTGICDAYASHAYSPRGSFCVPFNYRNAPKIFQLIHGNWHMGWSNFNCSPADFRITNVVPPGLSVNWDVARL